MGLEWSRTRIQLLSAVAMSTITIVTPARADGGERQEYNVEAGNLGDALRTVSRLSGREIIFSAEAVNGKHAPHLQGTYGADEAVRALLFGSHLTAEFRKDVVLIRGRSEASSEVADRSTDNDIVITGSYIRGGASASPVIAATRESIQLSGQNNLGEYVRSIPQNYGGGQNPGVSNSQGFRNQNLNNSSGLNLRGLGADATLTLVNGHRVAYDGVSQGIDISAIPLAAIERIEIVADGASALYGSDAVGGVANVILRRDFSGLTTSARLAASTDGGNEQQQYNGVAGSRWATGGIMATVDYSRFTEISARDRSYTRGLDDSATLVPGQKQFGVVMTGRQNIMGGLRFEIDGQFNDRRSANALAAVTTSSAFTNGNYAEPKVSSYAVTPTLRIDLPRGWQASLSGTYGKSRSEVSSRIFSQGIQTTRTILRYSNDGDSAEANAEGPLFKLPGGEVRLAIGAGYRSATLNVKVDRTLSGGSTTTTENETGSRLVVFGYSELSLPLVSAENAVPLVDSLRLNGAVRYENYKNVGDVAAPKFGLIYKPHPDVTIRASWGKSFKAPTLYQSYQSRYGNIVLGSSFPSIPANLGVLYVAGGNSALRPERATTWTASLAFEPKFIEGLRAEASYFEVHFQDRVVSPLTNALNAFTDPTNGNLAIRNPTAQQVADAIARLPQGATNYTGLPDSAVVIGGIVDGSLQNAARQSVRGVDLALQYRLELGTEQSVQFSGSASYLESDQQIAAGKPIVQLAGLIFNPPHWRTRFGGTYMRSNVSFSAFASHTGGTLDNRLQPFELVESFTTLDLVARIRSAERPGIFGGLEATIAATNLLNQAPDTIRNTNLALPPYDTTNYSAIGRVISLAITKSW